MNRYRLYKLASTEARYIRAKGATTVLSICTLALTLLSLLFYMFFLLSSRFGEQPDPVYAYLPVGLFLAFLVICFANAILRTRLGTYPVTLFYTSFCYILCAASGYLLIRDAWLWGSEARDVARFSPMLNTALWASLIAPGILLVLYLGLCFIKAKSPVSRLGWLYPLHVVIPLLVVGCVLLTLRVEKQPDISYWARDMVLLYDSLMLCYAARFAFKGALFRFSDSPHVPHQDVRQFAAQFDSAMEKLSSPADEDASSKSREEDNEATEANSTFDELSEEYSAPDLGDEQALLSRNVNNPNLPLIFTNNMPLPTIAEKTDASEGTEKTSPSAKNQTASKTAQKKPRTQTKKTSSTSKKKSSSGTKKKSTTGNKGKSKQSSSKPKS